MVRNDPVSEFFGATIALFVLYTISNVLYGVSSTSFLVGLSIFVGLFIFLKLK